MPAPSVAVLLAYESQIEPAWVSILQAAGLNAMQEFVDLSKVTPYVDVSLTNVVPTGQRQIYQGTEHYSAWTGTLNTRVVTQRGKNSDQHAAILGKIRILVTDFWNQFTPALLPWHQVRVLKEAHLDRGIEADRLLDWSLIGLQINFAVRPDAWPFGS